MSVATVGRLIVSQMLTLYTTPVVHLYMDRLQIWLMSHLRGRRHRRHKEENVPVFTD